MRESFVMSQNKKRALVALVYLFLFTVSYFGAKALVETDKPKNVTAQKIDGGQEVRTIACKDESKDDDLASLVSDKIEEVNCIFGGCNSFF